MAHWEQHGFGQWAIATLHEPEKVIGFGGVAFRKYIEDERLNLGYRFAPEAWGMGYATEVGRAALRCAFDQHGQSDAYAIVRPINAQSIRVLEKLPMKRIGSLDDVPGEPMSLLYWAGNQHPVS
ncbi:putative acetyltransferase [Collimonas arenae]|uniref:Putative acetyltransferase n=2 Tax=Collimonas arenae TaxID=279058 RepID=A0A0A1F9A4_9BURK|nr:putative acetyltransferase [Collimonas arenae]